MTSVFTKPKFHTKASRGLYLCGDNNKHLLNLIILHSKRVPAGFRCGPCFFSYKLLIKHLEQKCQWQGQGITCLEGCEVVKGGSLSAILESRRTLCLDAKPQTNLNSEEIVVTNEAHIFYCVVFLCCVI